jgi:hypothetical protein
MPLSLETTPLTPNALYAPQIVLQTAVVGGKLKTAAQICLAAAKVEDSGLESETWTPTGQDGMVYLTDLENLDGDLAGLQSQVDALYGSLVQIIASLNSIRKVL